MYFNKMMALVMIGLMATAGLAGCVGNDGSDSDDYDVTLVDITSASSNDCPDGGVTIYSGIDDDSDGILETDERDNTHHACNGADGASAVSYTHLTLPTSAIV